MCSALLTGVQGTSVNPIAPILQRGDRLHLSFAGHPRSQNQPNPSPDEPDKASSVMLGGSSREEKFSGTHTSVKLPL